MNAQAFLCRDFCIAVSELPIDNQNELRSLGRFRGETRINQDILRVPPVTFLELLQSCHVI